MQQQSQYKFLLIWFAWFCAVYLLFLPIKGDQFSHYPWVYGYIFTTLIIIWLRYFVSKGIWTSYFFKIISTIILTAILFPIFSYFYNGKLHFIRNAAEFNYPTVLNVLLDSSNQEELNSALFYAKEGKNNLIVENLRAKGAR